VAQTVKFKEASSLKHQPNLGEEPNEVSFAEGDEVSVLQEWENSYLIKNAEGKLFNVGKERVEPAN
jgi:hypothetical protein